jgi:hypothetical protein
MRSCNDWEDSGLVAYSLPIVYVTRRLRPSKTATDGAPSWYCRQNQKPGFTAEGLPPAASRVSRSLCSLVNGVAVIHHCAAGVVYLQQLNTFSD